MVSVDLLKHSHLMMKNRCRLGMLKVRRKRWVTLMDVTIVVRIIGVKTAILTTCYESINSN